MRLGLWLLLLLSGTAFADPLSAEAQKAELLPTEPFLNLEVRGVPLGETLRSLVTTGTLERQGRSPEGVHRLRWKPPERRVPTEVCAVFWVQSHESPELATAAWTLVGKTQLEVDTAPQAEVRVQIGRHMFGAQTANASGKATVPIEVRPSDHQAKVIAQNRGQRTVKTVPLVIPKSRQIALAFGGSSPAPRDWVHLVIVQTGATPAKPTELIIQGAATKALSVSQPHVTVSLIPSPQSPLVKVTAQTDKATPATSAEVTLR